MYICADFSEGRPPRLYRTVEEISGDISEVRRKISEVDGQLTVRSVLMEMISVWADESPDKWIPELEEVIGEAREALDSLSALNKTLDALILELEEAKAIFGFC